MNNHAKYLRESSFISDVILQMQTHTHSRAERLLHLDHLSSQWKFKTVRTHKIYYISIYDKTVDI